MWRKKESNEADFILLHFTSLFEFCVYIYIYNTQVCGPRHWAFWGHNKVWLWVNVVGPTQRALTATRSITFRIDNSWRRGDITFIINLLLLWRVILIFISLLSIWKHRVNNKNIEILILILVLISIHPPPFLRLSLFFLLFVAKRKIYIWQFGQPLKILSYAHFATFVEKRNILIILEINGKKVK